METADARTVAAPPPPPTDERRFHEFIARRAHAFLSLTRFLGRQALNSRVLTRPLLGEILAQSSQVEELLDAYGARRNLRWHTFRRLIATTRLFSAVGYKLLHIDHSRAVYQLLPVRGDFTAATETAILFTGNVLMQIAAQILAEAERLRLPVPEEIRPADAFSEVLPPGRLPRDRMARKAVSAAGTVARLATAFLNLAAESEPLHVPDTVRPLDYPSCIPEPVSEEGLRQLEEKFHSLQSLYDTYVVDTDTEQLDPDLPILRGHISIIYHLLETATSFCHHYERHLMPTAPDTDRIERPAVHPRELLAVLMEYAVAYAGRFLVAARALCHAMLKRYAEIGRIVVPVPKYRGFHVRPSTLVARIAHHYGSEVRMELGGELYDASSPLDLFRANEKINAEKRRRLAEETARMTAEAPAGASEDPVAAVGRIVATLAARGKIVIYQRPLPLDELHPSPGETLSQFALAEIARLMAMGKIDIEASLEVAFAGDKRVLSDIALLAANGYGEDAFGNNIPLPRELSYLRK